MALGLMVSAALARAEARRLGQASLNAFGVRLALALSAVCHCALSYIRSPVWEFVWPCRSGRARSSMRMVAVHGAGMVLHRSARDQGARTHVGTRSMTGRVPCRGKDRQIVMSTSPAKSVSDIVRAESLLPIRTMPGVWP